MSNQWKTHDRHHKPTFVLVFGYNTCGSVSSGVSREIFREVDSVECVLDINILISYSVRTLGLNKFPFISSDDMKKLRRSSGRLSSFVCPMELSAQVDGMFWIMWLIRDDTLSLVSCLSCGLLGLNWFLTFKLSRWSLALSSCVLLSLRKTKILMWFGSPSFFVPLFHPCATLSCACGRDVCFLVCKVDFVHQSD